MPFDMEQEREARTRIDELAILRHAQHLKAIHGQDRAIQALEEVIREIRSRDVFELLAQIQNQSR